MGIAESTMCRFLQQLKLKCKKTKRNVKLQSETNGFIRVFKMVVLGGAIDYWATHDV